MISVRIFRAASGVASASTARVPAAPVPPSGLAAGETTSAGAAMPSASSAPCRRARPPGPRRCLGRGRRPSSCRSRAAVSHSSRAWITVISIPRAGSKFSSASSGTPSQSSTRAEITGSGLRMPWSEGQRRHVEVPLQVVLTVRVERLPAQRVRQDSRADAGRPALARRLQHVIRRHSRQQVAQHPAHQVSGVNAQHLAEPVIPLVLADLAKLQPTVQLLPPDARPRLQGNRPGSPTPGHRADRSSPPAAAYPWRGPRAGPRTGPASVTVRWRPSTMLPAPPARHCLTRSVMACTSRRGRQGE